MEKGSIKAIHDDDLDSFLCSLGLLHSVKNGEVNCTFCKKGVGLQNLHAVFPREKQILLCCSRASCTIKLKEELTYA